MRHRLPLPARLAQMDRHLRDDIGVLVVTLAFVLLGLLVLVVGWLTHHTG